MNAIILVGGFGTRLRPLTLTRPKALIPVFNQPFLSYQFQLLAQGGVTHVVLACNRRMQPWQRDFAKIAPKGVRLSFAYEKEPLGTGGAIRFAYEALKQKKNADEFPVLVLNGDVFIDLDVPAFVGKHQSNRAAATIALVRVDDPSRFGVVKLDDKSRVLKFLEKSKPPFPSHLINAGAYCLEPWWIELIPEGVVSIERDLFPRALKNNEPMFGFPIKGYWNDIGTPASYLQAHRDLFFRTNRWTQKTLLRKRGRLQGASSQDFLVRGNRVRIGQRCNLSQSVIMDDCRIGDDVTISGAILGRGCVIGANSQIKDGVVLGDKTVLPPYTRC